MKFVPYSKVLSLESIVLVNLLKTRPIIWFQTTLFNCMTRFGWDDSREQKERNRVREEGHGNYKNGNDNFSVLAQHKEVGIYCFGALPQKRPTMLMY